MPSATSGMLCAPESTTLRLPTKNTEASAAKPAVACTTMPPAKSSTPCAAIRPPPHTMWHRGKYTKISQATRKIR